MCCIDRNPRVSITEPGFHVFTREKVEGRGLADLYFGLWEPAHPSLVLVKDDQLLAYGCAAAQDRLLQRVHQWVDLGMRSAASFALRVYPSDAPVCPGEHEWVVKRSESQFLWRLDL